MLHIRCMYGSAQSTDIKASESVTVYLIILTYMVTNWLGV